MIDPKQTLIWSFLLQRQQQQRNESAGFSLAEFTVNKASILTEGQPRRMRQEEKIKGLSKQTNK